MSFESKEHYWVIILESSEGNCHFIIDTRFYCGSKKVRSTKYRPPVWYYVTPNDKVYVGEVETVVTVKEAAQ